LHVPGVVPTVPPSSLQVAHPLLPPTITKLAVEHEHDPPAGTVAPVANLVLVSGVWQ
jgi:hypothetical protein